MRHLSVKLNALPVNSKHSFSCIGSSDFDIVTNGNNRQLHGLVHVDGISSGAIV